LATSTCLWQNSKKRGKRREGKEREERRRERGGERRRKDGRKKCDSSERYEYRYRPHTVHYSHGSSSAMRF
jgi:hypothetical protein